MNINWNELRDKAHKAAIDKGFWDEENWSLPEKIALIHSEVSEALGADRKGLHCKASDTLKNWLLKTREETSFSSNFIFNIKDTFEDELADVAIRCLDLCGKLNIDINIDIDKHRKKLTFPGLHFSIPERLCELHSLISDYNAYRSDGKLIEILSYVNKIADYYDINLLKHIQLKMKYNAFREYKHGKEY